MTDPDARLRELLEQAAPGSPELDPASRTAAVVRRGRAERRRDRGLVGGAVAAVLAVAVGVPLALGGDDGPAEVASPPSPAPTAAPCPAESIDVSELTPVADLGEVTSIRACPAVGPRPGHDAGLPTEALVGVAAAAFAEDVAALPDHVVPAYCATVSMTLDPWALVVETADGSAVIGTATRVCSAVTIGGEERGSEAVLAVFTGNVARQQAGDQTPGSNGPSCPDGDQLAKGAETWNASFDVASATMGMVCYRVDPLGAPEYKATAGKLHLETLTTIRDDLATHIGAAPAEMYGCTDTGPQRLLVLANDAGDRAAYVDDRCSGGFTAAQGYWQPSAAAEAAIKEALGGGFSPR